ncbi:MAG: FAD-binding oxidoreductase [Pseudomonadota bacterium]
MSNSNPQTWYQESSDFQAQSTPPPRDRVWDVCVVGGGLAGLTTARELLRLGCKVLLLEAGQVGSGASGRNGGFVASGFAEDTENLIPLCGLETVQRLHSYSQMGVEYVAGAIEELSPGARMGEGMCLVWRHRDTSVTEAQIAGYNRNFDEAFDCLSAAHLTALLDTKCYYCGIRDGRGFHIHPLAYVHAIAQDVEDRGGTLLEKTPVLAIERNAQAFSIATKEQNFHADQIVLCTSAYDRSLYPPLTQAVLPVATHIVVTEPLSAATNPIKTRMAIADTRRAGDYYRMIDDNRLLWGGKITTRVDTPSNLDTQMCAAIVDVFPQLVGVNFDYRWSGLMGYCTHKMPIIGKLETGLWAATAFGGHGLNTTAMAGLLVASAIAEGDERWRDFRHFPLRRVNNYLGKLGVQLSYWGMQVRDSWDEFRARP